MANDIEKLQHGRRNKADDLGHSESRTRYSHLDGLRGLAALAVVFSHITPDFTTGLHEHGFGEVGKYWHLTSFPFVRLIWSGGNAAVPIFFVLSGFALSIGPLRRLKDKNGREVRGGLLGAVLRRPIRLYAPAIAITAIQALLLQIPGLYVTGGAHPPKVAEANLLGGLTALVRSIKLFNPFLDHEIEEFPYNQVMWTLPIELNGSLLVYGVLLVLSLSGIPGSGPGVKVPAAFALSLFCSGAIVLQMTRHWSIACFVWGIVLAVVDIWPVGKYFADTACEFYPETRALGHRWMLPVSSDQLLKKRTNPTVLPTIAQKLSSLAPYLCLVVGWYLLSIPGYPDHRYCADTSGWRFLNSMIPQPYNNDFRFVRYWTSIGALLIVHAVLRLRWLQRFFSSRILLFLGRISFALYLVHLPLSSIIEERIKALFGGRTAAALRGTFWDKSLALSNAGPPGLSLRFLVAMGFILPCFFLAAWAATVAIDEPSVRVSKWVTRKLGFERTGRTSSAMRSEV